MLFCYLVRCGVVAVQWYGAGCLYGFWWAVLIVGHGLHELDIKHAAQFCL